MSDHKIPRSHTSRLGPRSPRRLSLKLLLPERGLGLTRLDPSSATFKELPSPVPDRLLRNPLPAGCLSDRDLTLQLEHCINN